MVEMGEVGRDRRMKSGSDVEGWVVRKETRGEEARVEEWWEIGGPRAEPIAGKVVWCGTRGGKRNKKRKGRSGPGERTEDKERKSGTGRKGGGGLIGG
jgi:hypothetical protein